ncbi:DUF1801 domain-containing protein [Ekhidna sp.]|uniref:DUF1801 domain-containing protein n=1 Tax=Ekhidna sp. TaxID=2608089 RepID=UPI003C7ECE43
MDIAEYNKTQSEHDRQICDRLMSLINKHLPATESKIWHGHPVWFLDENPTVGYSKLKDCVRLMFWSGVSFEEPDLKPGTGKFKDASIRFTSVDQIRDADLKRWLEKSRVIQWDYKNIVKKKGRLDRLKF